MKSLIYLTLFAVLLSLSFASAVGVYPPVNESMVLYCIVKLEGVSI